MKIILRENFLILQLKKIEFSSNFLEGRENGVHIKKFKNTKKIVNFLIKIITNTFQNILTNPHTLFMGK